MISKNSKFKFKKSYNKHKAHLRDIIRYTTKVVYIAFVFAATFKGVDILCSLL